MRTCKISPTHSSEFRSNDSGSNIMQLKISKDRLYCFNSGVLAGIWIGGLPFPLVHLEQLSQDLAVHLQ